MFSIAKKLIIILVVLTVAVALIAFRPQPFHFSNEYQYVMFLSWLNRGGFAEEGPARLSQYNIAITFENRVANQKVTAEFDLDNEKIAVQIERIEDISTTEESIERSCRYYLEQLMFRLNTVNSFFVTDFTTALDIQLTLEGQVNTDRVASILQSDEVKGRLMITSGKFAQLPDGRYHYDLMLNNRYNLKVIFDSRGDLSRLARNLRNKESQSDKTDELQFPARREFAHYEMPAPVTPAPRYAPVTPHIPDPHVPLPVSVKDLSMVDYIKTYRDNNWGRELLHNKIENRERFIRGEFPSHRYSESRDIINLTKEKFQEHFSADLKLVERQLRDGILFSSSGEYHIDEGKNVTLATGEKLAMAELNEQEIDIIAPYMNQLVAMHRVMATRMLNFLIIPAEVPTTLVIRDPDREVIQLDSYTDLMLMLSYYWSDRNIYFNLDSVKKINNYVELSGKLVAHGKGEEQFDYAEVLFSLDKYQRIDIAMVILHTNVEIE